MTIFIADFEANGLRPDADRIWCGVLKEYGTDTIIRFNYGDGISIPPNSTLVMHNGIQYDRWLLKKVADISIPIHMVIDTLILSKMLWPQLKVPNGWKGKAKPHSIEAWGMRFGVKKPEQEQWDVWEPNMLHRCEQDVLITERLYSKCIEECKK
jgi:DNA polymerase III epsilon subunit-like protein